MAVIAAGSLRRRVLKIPKGDVRPTQRILRLALFSYLADFIDKAIVLDLFAGTGAFGIESLSRGARKVVFVDITKMAEKTIKENIEILGIKEKCEVIRADAMEALLKLKRRDYTFDIVFIDPPYTMLRNMKAEEYKEYMLELTSRASEMLNEKSIVIMKYPKKLPIATPSGLVQIETRTYGLNALTFFAQKEYIIHNET